MLLCLVHTIVVSYHLTWLLLGGSGRSLTWLVFISSELLLGLDRLLGHSRLLHHLMIHRLHMLLLLLLLHIDKWLLGYCALHVDITMVSN